MSKRIAGRIRNDAAGDVIPTISAEIGGGGVVVHYEENRAGVQIGAGLLSFNAWAPLTANTRVPPKVRLVYFGMTEVSGGHRIMLRARNTGEGATFDILARAIGVGCDGPLAPGFMTRDTGQLGLF